MLQVEGQKPGPPIEEGVVSMEPLLRAFEEVLGKEEFERICGSCTILKGVTRSQEESIHRTLVEASIMRSIQDNKPQGESEEGGLEYEKSDFEAMYFETLSREELDQIWEECENMSRTSSLSSDEAVQWMADTTFSG